MTASRNTNSPVSINDVAQAARVSRATAARALGGYGAVSSKARERVLTAAEQLGYRPNTLARAMVTGHTSTLGAIVADIEDPYFSQLLRGLTDRANQYGYDVIVTNTDERVDKELNALRVLREKRVDGLVVAPASLDCYDHLIDALAAGIPMVSVDRTIAQLAIDSVVSDNFEAARRTIERLLAAGHRRIAAPAIGAKGRHPEDVLQPYPISTTIERIAGFRAAMDEAGLEIPDVFTPLVEGRRDLITAVVIDLLDSDNPPTALFALDDSIMLAFLDAVHTLGLSIPDDVSLVGFDDAPWTTAVIPALSVVSQPVYDIGTRAAEILAERIAGGDEKPRTEVLATTWIDRDSIGPPPA